MAPHETPLFDPACDRSCCTQGPRCFPVAKTTGISRRTHSRSTSQMAKKTVSANDRFTSKTVEIQNMVIISTCMSHAFWNKGVVFSSAKKWWWSSMIQISQLLHLTVCFWQFLCWIHQGTILQFRDIFEPLMYHEMKKGVGERSGIFILSKEVWMRNFRVTNFSKC